MLSWRGVIMKCNPHHRSASSFPDMPGKHLILERDVSSARKAMIAVERFIQKAQAQEATSSF